MEPRYPRDTVAALAKKHGIEGECSVLSTLGVVNDIWAIGPHHVVRIPKRVDYASTMLAESVAIPCVYSAGVKTAKLIEFDEDRDIVDVPYGVFQRVPGSPVGASKKSPTWDLAAFEWASFLNELGGQLVTLHQKVADCPDARHLLNPWWIDAPLDVLSDSVDAGHVTLEEAKWVENFVQRLSAAFSYDPAGPCDRHVFVHHDLHPWNVMVADGNRATILDWGNACWGDSAADFTGFPLWALPPLVQAYQLQGGHTDEGFEGRVLWMWLAIALLEPTFLDASSFLRHWWRLPEDGVKELQYRLLLLPEPWSRWAV